MFNSQPVSMTSNIATIHLMMLLTVYCNTKQTLVIQPKQPSNAQSGLTNQTQIRTNQIAREKAVVSEQLFVAQHVNLVEEQLSLQSPVQEVCS